MAPKSFVHRWTAVSHPLHLSLHATSSGKAWRWSLVCYCFDMYVQQYTLNRDNSSWNRCIFFKQHPFVDKKNCVFHYSGPTPLIPLARTTTGLDSICTKIIKFGERGALYAYAHCGGKGMKNIMHHDFKMARDSTQRENLSCLSVNYLGVRVSMPRNVV